MNVVSKVMAFLMLVLSIVYCGTAIVLFTHRADWRGKYEKVSADYEKYTKESKSQIVRLDDEVAVLKDSLEGARTNLDRVTEEFKEQRDEVTRAEKEIENLKVTIAAKDLKIDSKDRAIAEKDEAVTSLRTKTDELNATTEAAKTERNEAVEKMVEAQTELTATKAKLEETEVAFAEAKKQLELKEGIIAQLRENGIPVEEIAVSGGPTTPIRGQILAVRADANLVMLSVGSQNEVKQGYRFTVYRDSEYLGKVEVEKIFPDMCSARILTDFTEKQIKEGDSASTRVY